MTDALEPLRTHAFGYIPEAIVRLVEEAARGGGDHLADRFLAAITDAGQWASITPEDIPVLSTLSASGQPLDDAARQADAEACCDARAVLAGDGRWLLPVLHHAGARVLVAPGVFGYLLPSAPTALVEVRGLGARICPDAKTRPPVSPPQGLDDGPLPLHVLTSYRIGRPGVSVTAPIEDEATRAADLELQRAACEAVVTAGLLPLFRSVGAVVFAMPGRIFYSLPSAPLSLVEIPAP
jgi:hypothetical protein